MDHPGETADARQERDAVYLEKQRVAEQSAVARGLFRETTPALEKITFPIRRRFRRVRRWIASYMGRGASGERDAEFPPVFEPYRATIPAGIRPTHRILHVIGSFCTGGSAQLVVDLAERLSGRFEHLVLTPWNPPPRGYTGIKVLEYSPFTSLEEAVTLIGRIHPDLVHLHYSPPEGELPLWYLYVVKAAERLGLPIVENVNVPVPPLVSPAVVAYVYVSDFVLNTYGRRDSFNVRIYPGSDVDRFASHSSAERRDVVGMVYRLDGDKLDPDSIEPLIKVVQRRPKTEVMIVGGGPLRGVYENRVAEEGVSDRFTFTRYVSYSQLPRVYDRFGVFAAPVWRESFGQVTSFAMAMGIPVVGYAVGALPEIVDDPTLLAAPGDSAALATIVTGLLEDAPRRMAVAERNRARARRLFSVEAMIEEYDELYGRVFATHASNRSCSRP
jgi:glycosyltransferase involved in cell wall biosynthesis